MLITSKFAGLYNPRPFRSLVGLGLELLSKGNKSESMTDFKVS